MNLLRRSIRLLRRTENGTARDASRELSSLPLIASRVAFALAVFALASCRHSTDNDARRRLAACWREPQTGSSTARAAFADSAAFFATGDGHVIARDQKSGRLFWSTKIDVAEVLGMNLIAESGVVVAPSARYTVGLDVGTGRELWRYYAPLDYPQNPQQPRSGYVGRTRIDSDGSTVFIPAWGASVSAVDLKSGQAKWVWQTPDTASFRSGSMGVRVHGDTVYATAWHYLNAAGTVAEPWLVALDRVTGRELWRVVIPSYTFGTTVEGAPVVSDDLVIFSTIGGYEFAFDRFTTQLRWKFTPTPVFATFAQSELHDGIVYHDGGDNAVYALRASDGQQIWKGVYGGQMKRDFLVTERALYISVDGDFIALDRATGQRIQKIDYLTGPIQSPAAFASGRIFVTGTGFTACYREP